MTRLILNSTTMGISSIATAYFLCAINGSLPTIKYMTGIEGQYEGLHEGLLVSGLSIGSLVGCLIALLVV